MDKKETFLMKPKVDFCFKELMGDAEIRRGFISALLGVKPEEIEETELLPAHLKKEYPEDKLGILDIRVSLSCRAESGKDSFRMKQQLDLEIQVAAFPSWQERSIFYLAKMYVGQIEKGEDYDVLQKCIHVGILDFILFDEDEEFYSRFHLWEDHRHRLYTDKLEIHILELPKLGKREYPETELLNWARFFNAEQREEFEMAAETSTYIERAYERLTDMSADKEKRLEYEAREKAIRDYNYLMKKNLELGRQQGMKKGMEEGMEEGIRAFIELCQEMCLSREDTATKIIQKFAVSSDMSERYLGKYWMLQEST